MAVDISIIIVNYNVRHFIKRTIESILSSKLEGLKLKIYVVDNASIDGSVDMIASEFPDVHLIENQKNVGFSIANNQALKITDSTYSLVLNPDTVIQEDTLRVCYDYMESNTQVGALGVKMIDGAGNFLPESKRSLPSVWNSFAKLSGLSNIFPKSQLFNGYALGHLDENQVNKIEVLCGAFMFVRQSTIDKVGMFDERFFMYGEDIDWSRRITEGGFEIHYIPDTTIIHFKGESTKKASLNYVKTFYGAMGLYVEKHYTGGAGKWFSRILKIAIGIRAGISGIRRMVSTAAKPILDATLIGAGIFAFSKFWARYYFDNPGYYADSNLNWNIISYSVIWGFVLWLVGYYQKNSIQKRIVGILSGMGVILMLYALLPDQYRSSRIIILVGTIIALITSSLTSWITKSRDAQEKQKNILIVAFKETAAGIIEALDRAQVKSKVLGIVNPDINSTKNLDYLNDLSQLSALSKVLKADEIIFSSENMSMKDIMKQMMKLDTRLSYKIAGDDSLSILGSNSKNTSGELYTVNIQYNLEDGYYRHIKRVLDVTIGLLLLILSPIFLLFNKLAIVKYYKNIMQVVLGIKTLVGYSGQREDFQNLPELSPSVINVLADGNPRNSNIHYAREYSIWKDLEAIIQNITNLTSN